MKRRSIVCVLGALVLAGHAVVCAAGDLTIVSKVTAAKGQPTTSTQYITATKMRIADAQSDIIVDLEAEKLTQVDHKKKKYFEATFEEMRQHSAEMEEMIAANPMMEKMMGKVSDVTVEKTSETREILGHTCTKYALAMGDNFSQILWVTPEIEMPIEYFEASKMMYAMMGPMAARFEKMIDAVQKIDGFSLATDVNVKVMGQDGSSKSEVTELKDDPIPDEIFAVPVGYKKKKSPFEG
jgi:hypothetical protein